MCEENDWGGTVLSLTATGTGLLSGVCGGVGNRVAGVTPPRSTWDGLGLPVGDKPKTTGPQDI